MSRKIEIFTYGSSNSSKVNCSSCPKSCASRDQVTLTGEMLYNQLLALYGDKIEVVLHDYENGDKPSILDRQNQLYKSNGISRMVNTILIGPLSDRIWPSIVVDEVIKTEGVLLDATQIGQYI